MHRQEFTSPRPRRNPPTLLGLVGLVLLAAGLGVGLWQATRPVADGVGGPAEDPLPGILATAGYSFTGGLLNVSGAPVLAPEELGPVFRPDEGPVTMRIGRGESFYDALTSRGAAHEDIMELVKTCKSFRNLTKVRHGEAFRVHITPDGGLRSVGFDLDQESWINWVREGDTYARRDGTYPVERILKGIGGTIEISLYTSLQDLGAPLALAAKLNDILGWDVDFTRDLRQGDTFRIIYEEVWKDGKLIRTGAIESAELVNRGKVRRAVRFADAQDSPGYYDPEGNNLQKQLMRAPVEYSRISSGFSYNRFHPVLKRWMPHLGVDYAAPLGTPVRAGGNGTVVAATRKKGNGRYVQIRHTNREYETFYLHLSRFAKGIGKGSQVKQGQVIGYVGATGYATGPHLDYRVKKGGRFVNPRKLKLPAAAPVPEELRLEFAAEVRRYDIALAAVTTGPPVAMPTRAVLRPPAWDAEDFATAELPVAVRAARLVP